MRLKIVYLSTNSCLGNVKYILSSIYFKTIKHLLHSFCCSQYYILKINDSIKNKVYNEMEFII